MTDLVAKVAEQRAVGLRHVLAGPLALGVVGLGDVDCDEPLRMARNDLGRLPECRPGIGQKVEGEPGLRILPLTDQRQPQAEEPVDQPVLGGLEALPAQQVLRRAEVRDRAVVAAGPAERIRVVRRHQPVAGLVRGIGAEAVDLLRCGQRAPAIAVLLGKGA